jgi:c-di-GMP-binding flagellar brake protein YcgR
MRKEEIDSKPRYATVNFEKRKHPRFSVDLPAEYNRADLSVKQGHATNASEGGLLLYLPEQIEVGKQLRLKLFFSMASELQAIEALVEVAWTEIHLGKDWGDYRTGVRFIDISADDMNKLRDFLKSLSG